MGKKKLNEPMEVNIDKLIGFGWYQLFHIITLKMADLAEIVNMSFMMFAGEWMLLEDKQEVCARIQNGTCGIRNSSYHFASIAVEWDLICDRVGIVYLNMSVQMVGVLLGAPLFGQISDIFGRKRTLLVTFTGMCGLGFASSFSPSVEAFVAFRFFIGIMVGGSVTVGYVFRIEFIRPKHRVWVAVIASPLSYMWFALLAYLCGDWRSLSLIGNAIGLLPIILILFCRESPRWQIQKGRTEAAKATLRSVARVNRDPLDEGELSEVIERELTRHRKRRRPHSFWHLFYSWKLTRYSIILPFAWFTVSCISYGIMFGISKLSGSPYLNSLIYGGLRFVVSFFIAVGDLWAPWCGRKFFHGAGATVITVACSILFAIFLSGQNAVSPYSQVVRVGALMAACMASPLWLTVYLYSAELYPTPVRNLANSFCSVFARVGGIVAPQILFLAEFWSPATYLVFGVLAIVDGTLFQLLLPETKGQPLPEQMPPKSEKALLAECCGRRRLPAPEASEAQLMKERS